VFIATKMTSKTTAAKAIMPTQRTISALTLAAYVEGVAEP
jgi:hypothetical protein